MKIRKKTMAKNNITAFCKDRRVKSFMTNVTDNKKKCLNQLMN